MQLTNWLEQAHCPKLISIEYSKSKVRFHMLQDTMKVGLFRAGPERRIQSAERAQRERWKCNGWGIQGITPDDNFGALISALTSRRSDLDSPISQATMFRWPTTFFNVHQVQNKTGYKQIQEVFCFNINIKLFLCHCYKLHDLKYDQ